MRIKIALLALCMAPLAVGAASASIVGPKDDRIPIMDATKPCPPHADRNLACGMTVEQVNAILNAGARFQCPVRTTPA